MPLTKRFLDAAERVGIPKISDYNGPEQDGAALAQVTQRNGRRWSTADAYLRPAQDRPNLEIRTGVHVARIALEGDRAVGVVLRDGRGREETVRAEREVLLSAGAIGSPQLLMLSGIGPADHLREVGVDVALDSPNVGAQPDGPPVRRLRVGVDRGRVALRRRQAQAAAGVAAAPLRTADLDRSPRRWRSSAAVPACPPPTSSTTSRLPTSSTTAPRSSTATRSRSARS